MGESTQHKLDRVRRPRVQITYDVETGGAIVMKELPFVVGIMADLSANPLEPLPKIKERKFVEVDRDNFNDILESASPRLTFRVDNKLIDDGSKIGVELKFRDMDDFQPLNVVKQLEPLRKLFEARQRLSDLMAKLDGNDNLDRLLQDVLANSEKLDELKARSGKSDEAAEPEATETGAAG